MTDQHTGTNFNGVCVGIPIAELAVPIEEKFEKKCGITKGIPQYALDALKEKSTLNAVHNSMTPGGESKTETDIMPISVPETKPKRYVMYILVNTDLKMEKGKIAGQVGHVVGIITEEIIRKAYESVTPESLEDYQNYENWIRKDMYTKVVLKATEPEMRYALATEKKCRFIIDAGRTQIAPNSLTVVGFFPRNDLEEKMKKFKLL